MSASFWPCCSPFVGRLRVSCRFRMRSTRARLPLSEPPTLLPNLITPRTAPRPARTAQLHRGHMPPTAAHSNICCATCVMAPRWR